MVETVIRTLLLDFNLTMLALAFVAAGWLGWKRRGEPEFSIAETLLAWLLLLSVGGQGIYTFVIHVFFPQLSAANIGWAVSPFQYEVGIADLTVGVLGVIAFWGNFSFRLAAVIAGIVWYWGDAIGHVKEMIVANNYAPGNAGPWFWTDVFVPILLIACTVLVWQQQKRQP
ncbi:MAG: DUF6790 family protein [Pirellulales bacterium]